MPTCIPLGSQSSVLPLRSRGGREVESSNLSESTARADREWVRQASLFVGCHRPERCALIMIDHGGSDWNFCPSGCGDPPQLCWDPSLLSVVGKPVSTGSASRGLEPCCAVELWQVPSALSASPSLFVRSHWKRTHLVYQRASCMVSAL